jgi:hypothetical protein
MTQLDASLGNEVYDVNAGFDLINGGHNQLVAVSI